MTKTEAKWAERVREWRSSGRTADAFAEGRGFEPSTLRYWASRLKVETTTAGAASSAPANASVPMARVVRRQARVATAPVPEPAAIVVVVGPATISVDRGFDAGLLRDVVAALGAPR